MLISQALPIGRLIDDMSSMNGEKSSLELVDTAVDKQVSSYWRRFGYSMAPNLVDEVGPRG